MRCWGLFFARIWWPKVVIRASEIREMNRAHVRYTEVRYSWWRNRTKYLVTIAYTPSSHRHRSCIIRIWRWEVLYLWRRPSQEVRIPRIVEWRSLGASDWRLQTLMRDLLGNIQRYRRISDQYNVFVRSQVHWELQKNRVIPKPHWGKIDKQHGANCRRGNASTQMVVVLGMTQDFRVGGVQMWLCCP